MPEAPVGGRAAGGKLERLRATLVVMAHALRRVPWMRALWDPDALVVFRHAGQKLATLRAALAAIAARAMAAVGDAARAAHAPGADLELPGEETWELLPEPAARRQVAIAQGKALRSLGLVAALAFVLFVVLDGPATATEAARTAWRQYVEGRTQHAANALGATLNASVWIAARLPVAAFHTRGITLRPAPSDPQTAYACWHGAHGPDGNAGPLLVYATHDGAYSWSALVPPVAQTSQCDLIVDVADPERVLIEVAPAGGAGCAVPLLFASADGGGRWDRVAVPQGLQAICDLSLLSDRGWLYAWSPSAQRQLRDAPAAQLLTSANDGATWRPAIAGLATSTLASVLDGRADGALLTLVRSSNVDGHTLAAELWCSASPGAPWTPVSAVPADAPVVFAASDSHDLHGCDWGALYAARYSTADGLPMAGAVPTRIQTNSPSGWHALPSLPLAGAAHDLPAGDGADILGVGSSGILLVEALYTSGAGPFYQGGVTPARSVWGWEPNSKRWLLDTHPEFVNSFVEGISWGTSATHGPSQVTLWLYTLNAGDPAFTGVFRSTVGDSRAGAVSPPSR
jgi:hypothetical protein